MGDDLLYLCFSTGLHRRASQAYSYLLDIGGLQFWGGGDYTVDSLLQEDQEAAIHSELEALKGHFINISPTQSRTEVTEITESPRTINFSLLTFLF